MEDEQATLTTQQNIIRTSLEMVQNDLKATESANRDMIIAAELRRVMNNYYDTSIPDFKFILFYDLLLHLSVNGNR